MGTRTLVGMGRGTRQTARLLSVLVAALVWLAVMSGPAAAHPLGNFSVNHSNDLTIRPDGMDLLAVVDSAEIPTQQDLPAIDTDGDDSLSDQELAAAAAVRCPEVADAQSTTVDGTVVDWNLASSTMESVPGAAGLPTLRLSCAFRTTLEMSRHVTIEFTDDYRADRVGWHEITATGQGMELVDPPVPTTSISNTLRDYPQDLLSSPLDVRSTTLKAQPGSNSSGVDQDELIASGDPFSRVVATGNRWLESAIGRDSLTPLVGVLAVLLAMLLGAGHAVLPGHGKTVMAAYLAGRRGTRADALVVGATVTITHTAGVLLLGLVLTVGSAVAGEVVLQRLGLLSGILIAAIGVSLLRDALRSRRARSAAQDGTNATSLTAVRRPMTVAAGSPTQAVGPTDEVSFDEPLVDHAAGHDHDHTHGHEQPGEHAHTHGHGHSGSHSHALGHSHGPLDDDPRFTRRGLVGMAIAGGLVPSPSALVVLLGSVALGRTLFGVSLVLAYGIGMAATLTGVGLLLVHLRGRLDGMARRGRLGRLANRLAGALPVATAVLVLVVGLGLVIRGLVFVG